MADYVKGSLSGDIALRGLLGRLRTTMTNAYRTDDPSLPQPSQIGVSTGAAVGGGALNPDAVAGKLALDKQAFRAAFSHDPTGVRVLLDGFATSVLSELGPDLQAGGSLDTRIAAAAAADRRTNDQIAATERRLAQKQDLLKKQFGAMQSALQQSHARGLWLAAQLARLQTWL